MGRRTMDVHEVAPGVHRIAWAIGAGPMASHLLAGGRLLPADARPPATAALGRRPDGAAPIGVTPAAADHIGGVPAVRERFPHALPAGHAAAGDRSARPGPRAVRLSARPAVRRARVGDPCGRGEARWTRRDGVVAQMPGQAGVAR